MLDPILYRDSTWTCILLDLPASLQEAQSSRSQICSSPALTRPYPSTEPKGKKLDAARAAIPPWQRNRDEQIAAKISQALTLIQGQTLEDADFVWCYPRFVSEAGPTQEMHVSLEEHAILPSSISMLSSASELNNLDLCDVPGKVLINPLETSITMVVSGQKYLIPPKVTFMIFSIANGAHTLMSLTSCLPLNTSSFTGNGFFDLILMDPPWSNRSVRHSKAYKTSENRDDEGPFSQTMPILSYCLKSDGMAAVWITNKMVVREQVLSALNEIGLSLQEEWIWTKITEQGEPVYPVEGIWRKPYECVLVFKRVIPAKVLTRVIFAVPDLHSRKPCLKRLFERSLPSQYQALELFARNLVSGWWSLGNEVLKFQHANSWESHCVTT